MTTTFIPSGNIRGPIIHEPVLRLSITSGAKLLYGILCSAANDKDHCWLALQTMADKLACSISSVKRHLKELKDTGLIAIRHRHGHSSFFTLLPPPVATSESPEQDSINPEIVESPASNPSGESNMNCTQSKLNPPQPKMSCINNLNKIIQEIPPTPNNALTREPPEKMVSRGGGDFSDFEKVYAAYPRKEAKGLAKIAWTQLARNGALPELAVILASISRFSASHNWQRENGRFIPQLSNFLKGERWNDPLSETEIEEKAAKEASEKARRKQEEEEEQRRIESEEKKALHKPDFDAFAAKFKGSFHFPMVFGIWMYFRDKGVAPFASDVPEDNRLGIMDFIKSFANRVRQPAHSGMSQGKGCKHPPSFSGNTSPLRSNCFRQKTSGAIEGGFKSTGEILKSSSFLMGIKNYQPKLRPAMAC